MRLSKEKAIMNSKILNLAPFGADPAKPVKIYCL